MGLAMYCARLEMQSTRSLTKRWARACLTSARLQHARRRGQSSHIPPGSFVRPIRVLAFRESESPPAISCVHRGRGRVPLRSHAMRRAVYNSGSETASVAFGCIRRRSVIGHRRGRCRIQQMAMLGTLLRKAPPANAHTHNVQLWVARRRRSAVLAIAARSGMPIGRAACG